MKMDSAIRQEFAKLDNALVLVLVGAKYYVDTNMQIIRYLTVEKKLPGVYVTINKPYKTIKRILEEAKIPTSRIIFVDAISNYAGSESKKTKDCVFIDTPADLTGISIAISEAVEALPTQNKFLFLDSLSTLLIYNSAGSVAKFAHFLTAKIRAWEITGIIISMEKETDKTLVNRLAQFCDHFIEIGGEKNER
jgi:KaiC/GvpD/RAD55 family RecA-like ATPase